jgi:hypothetical protein
MTQRNLPIDYSVLQKNKEIMQVLNDQKKSISGSYINDIGLLVLPDSYNIQNSQDYEKFIYKHLKQYYQCLGLGLLFVGTLVCAGGITISALIPVLGWVLLPIFVIMTLLCPFIGITVFAVAGPTSKPLSEEVAKIWEFYYNPNPDHS